MFLRCSSVIISETLSCAKLPKLHCLSKTSFPNKEPLHTLTLILGVSGVTAKFHCVFLTRDVVLAWMEYNLYSSQKHSHSSRVNTELLISCYTGHLSLKEESCADGGTLKNWSKESRQWFGFFKVLTLFCVMLALNESFNCLFGLCPLFRVWCQPLGWPQCITRRGRSGCGHHAHLLACCPSQLC